MKFIEIFRSKVDGDPKIGESFKYLTLGSALGIKDTGSVYYYLHGNALRLKFQCYSRKKLAEIYSFT